MQNKEVTAMDMVLISIPVDMIVEIGIEDNSVIEIYTDEDKIIIQKAVDTSNYKCDGQCDNCPLNECGCPYNKRTENLCSDCRDKIKKRGQVNHD